MKKRNQKSGGRKGFVRLLLFQLFFIFSVNSFAQEVTYELLEDDPLKVRNKFVALEFMAADIGGKRNSNTISVGANSVFSLKNKISLEGGLRVAVFKDEDAPFSMQFEAGGYLPFMTGSSTKDVKVRIDGEFVTVENRHAYKEYFIHVPAKRANIQTVRAGAYFNRKGYEEGPNVIPYTLFGAYGGWGMTQKTNLVVKVKTVDGKPADHKNPLHYRGFTRIFVDAIFTPVSLRDFTGTTLDATTSEVKNRFLGGRAGFAFYKDGPKWFNKFMWGGEVGYRPIDGLYMRFSVGYSILRAK